MADLATFDVQSMNRVDLVTVSGRIDSSNAGQFDEILKGIVGKGRNNIVLEMNGVSYMSSAGLRALVSTLRTCKRNRGDLRLAAPSERVVDVLKLAGLNSMFSSYPDSVAAVGSF
ncbi:MAG: STAS domain-containing protein [Ardenticatenaceae bacterium]|nr:STAS domain-containing protein [Ardenticatenaceae bacterium]